MSPFAIQKLLGHSRTGTTAVTRHNTHADDALGGRPAARGRSTERAGPIKWNPRLAAANRRDPDAHAPAYLCPAGRRSPGGLDLLEDERITAVRFWIERRAGELPQGFRQVRSALAADAP